MRTTCRFDLEKKKKELGKRESMPSCSLWKRHRHKQNRLPWRDSTVEILDGPLPLSYSQQRQ